MALFIFIISFSIIKHAKICDPSSLNIISGVARDSRHYGGTYVSQHAAAMLLPAEEKASVSID